MIPSQLLARLGVDDGEAQAFLRSDTRAQPPSSVRWVPGSGLPLARTVPAICISLIFPLNGGKDRALVVERDDTAVSSRANRPCHSKPRWSMKSAEIRYSLFGASDAAGIPDSVATGLADIFGGDIDFHRDIRKGDRFSVIYESVNHLGRLVRTGRILAAEFVNDGKTYRAVWFEGEDGKGGYYTPEGKNIRKAFLRSPLEFSRITSGFSRRASTRCSRKCAPIGASTIGAPTGTRVKATGDGVVEFVGRQGGYGNVVILRHQGHYATVYGHLSGFAPGIRNGVQGGTGRRNRLRRRNRHRHGPAPALRIPR